MTDDSSTPHPPAHRATRQAPVDFTPPLSFRVKKLIRTALRYTMGPKVIHQEKLVVMDEQGGCTNPIFLTGMHRSGTSLMRRIVDSHSSIACPGESFFLVPFARLLEEGRFREGLESMGFDEEGIAAGLRRTASYYFDVYSASKQKPRWADKTPEYVRMLPFIDAVFGPGCQYVMIYRHPFDVLNSLLASGWDFSFEQWDCLQYHEDHFLNFVLYHADVLQRQLDFEAAHPERCHRVRYEDLVSNPEDVLRPMFEFLGEPWEDGVMAFHEKQHDAGQGDPHSRITKGFKPSVGNWKGWSREHIEHASSHLATQLEQLDYHVEA